VTDTKDLVHVFAEHAATVRYEDLPLAAREAAKKSILDTLGVSLAAVGLEPAAQGVADIVAESGGAQQCTLLAMPGRAPALMAAFANGALAHCLDFDDQTPWGQHCSSSIIPAVFALAERRGGVSGRDLIAAIAAGQDIFARLLRNVSWRKDWNFSTVGGVFAATAASCRTLGLSPESTAHALGIATMQSCGVMEMVAGRGSDLRGLYAGFSAKGAVLAAMMAEKGITGIDRAFEGPNGIFACYFGGQYDRPAIVKDIGADFQSGAMLYKRWPCVGTSHSHLKAAIDIVVEHNLNSQDIAEIRLHVGDFHRLMSEPLHERIAPVTLADAKFSLPFLVAIAIVRRGMSVADFTEAGLRDQEILAVARKVGIVVDAGLNWGREMPPGRVEIHMKDARSWIKEGRDVPGSPDNPMSWADISAKFRECASVAARPLSNAQLDHAENLARSLEQLADGTEIIRSLAGVE
jgi:2-methylcitrate dehydratase PrpD